MTLACAFFGVPALPAPAIVGGTATTTDEWPWQGHLTIQEQFACGLTLIHPRVALTAAHCVEVAAPNDLYVRFGRTDLTVPDKHEEAATVEAVYIPPGWDGGAGNHWDYALLLLEQKIHGMKPIELFTPPDPTSPSFSLGDPAWITGWGITRTSALSSDWVGTNVLLEAQVGLADCSYLGHSNALFLCVNGTPNVCQGDSGGPIMVEDERGKGFQQIGVASWSDPSCEAYGGFVNVTRGPVRVDLDAALAELTEKARPPRAGATPDGPPPPVGAGPPPRRW